MTHGIIQTRLGPDVVRHAGDLFRLAKQQQCLINLVRSKVIDRIIGLSTGFFPIGNGLVGTVAIEMRGEFVDGTEGTRVDQLANSQEVGVPRGVAAVDKDVRRTTCVKRAHPGLTNDDFGSSTRLVDVCVRSR